jgi:hypothetical protein
MLERLTVGPACDERGERLRLRRGEVVDQDETASRHAQHMGG